MPEDSSIVISDTVGRLRMLEHRQENLREKLLIINQNMIESHRKLLDEIRLLNASLAEMKSSLSILHDNVKSIIKDADTFARKDQLKVVEKYINLWSPLNFVTEEEVKKLIKKRPYATRKKIPKRKHK